jgi:hypothetical protein
MVSSTTAGHPDTARDTGRGRSVLPRTRAGPARRRETRSSDSCQLAAGEGGGKQVTHGPSVRRAGPDREHLGIGSKFEDDLATGATRRSGRLRVAHHHDAAKFAGRHRLPRRRSATRSAHITSPYEHSRRCSRRRRNRPLLDRRADAIPRIRGVRLLLRTPRGLYQTVTQARPLQERTCPLGAEGVRGTPPPSARDRRRWLARPGAPGGPRDRRPGRAPPPDCDPSRGVVGSFP